MLILLSNYDAQTSGISCYDPRLSPSFTSNSGLQEVDDNMYSSQEDSLDIDMLNCSGHISWSLDINQNPIEGHQYSRPKNDTKDRVQKTAASPNIISSDGLCFVII